MRHEHVYACVACSHCCVVVASSLQVPAILAAALPSIVHMRGERNRKTVQRMLKDIYYTGLHMHAPPTSAVNSQVCVCVRACVRACVRE